MLKVFGHLNPDTDTTCSAISYAWFLSETGKEATPYILGKPNKETAYVLERFGFPTPELLSNLETGDQVVIVDTNNPEEVPADLGNAVVKEIVDHHKLAGLTTPEPLSITMKPVACTATIIQQIIEKQGVIISEHIAGLMLACILSDTLKFTSPTTTEEDKEAAKKLAEIAKVDVEELASAMFAAKSNLDGMSPKDILLSDSKVFTMGSKKVRISSLETTDPQQALKIESDLRTAMGEIKTQENLDGYFFFIVDIFNSSSVLVLLSDVEKEIAGKAFEAEISDEKMELPGVVSRKKQMVPPLERAIG